MPLQYLVSISLKSCHNLDNITPIFHQYLVNISSISLVKKTQQRHINISSISRRVDGGREGAEDVERHLSRGEALTEALEHVGVFEHGRAVVLIGDATVPVGRHVLQEDIAQLRHI